MCTFRLTKLIEQQQAKINYFVIDPSAVETLANITASKVRLELQKQGMPAPVPKKKKEKKEQ